MHQEISSRGSTHIVTQSMVQHYVREALAQAVYENLRDGRVVATVPPCKGVIVFGVDHRSAQQELSSVLEEWTMLGVRLCHTLPVLGGVDLNTDDARALVQY